MTIFRPISDLIKVFLPMLKFSASSLISGTIDFALVILIQALTSNLLLAVISARIISAVINYILNKTLVFEGAQKSKATHSLPKYFLLAIIILLSNYQIIHFLNEVLILPIFFSKLLTEALLFIFSYWSQRKFVFMH